MMRHALGGEPVLPLQHWGAGLASAPLMRWLVLLVFLLLSQSAFAQAATDHKLAGQPIEINATGGTNYENGIATARENVAIHLSDTDIYGDRAEYNTETHDVHVFGHVRIYRGTEMYVGERGTYNTETKKISADEMRTINAPFFVGGEQISSIDANAKLVLNGIFTTHDSANPDFRMRARRVRIYEGDRVILRDVTFYVGKVPIFYWPYVYQSLDDDFNFLVTPAYLSSWGPSLLGRVTFPITDHIKATARLDFRGRRGVAGGLDPYIEYGKKNTSFARLRTYFLEDNNALLNRTSLPRDAIPTERFRLSIENRTNFTEDIYGTVDITKLSDQYVLQDFFQAEFRLRPEPDNFITLTKYNPFYTLTAFSRFQVNNFFEATERLPEISLDIKRQPLFGGPIFYEGEASAVSLRRDFPHGSPYHDYESDRFDTFHQLTFPNTYFGWLSVVPRVGVRGTYYSETRNVDNTFFTPDPNPLVPDFLIPPPPADMPLQPGGDRFRTVVNAGVEASFKVSRTWESAQSRTLGLDGLRHIIQPFLNFSYVTGDKLNPIELYQFDRYQPSTQLRPLDFPQFSSIDSIDNWTIARIGVRNRLQTRRDDSTINWLELETYLDVNFDNPYNRSDYSNLYNNLRFSPLPWASVGISSQVPLLTSGFTEINTDLRIQPIAALQLNLGHRFLNENPFFDNSSVYTLSAYYRLNDNWGIGAYERYEAITGYFEEQRYALYRDLTSWVASIGGIVRNNGSVKEYGVLLTFTLKALPKFSFDLNFDPGAQGTESQGGGLVP